jgi:hypothetical protein
MASELSDFISQLESFGFYDVALPFILVFTLFFAILQKIKIFGENSKNFNSVIALVMAFLVVRQENIIEVINQFLPQVSLITLIFVVILILIGVLLGPAEKGWSGIPLGFGIVITLVAVSLAFLSSSAPLGINWPSWLSFSNDDFRLLIGLLVFFVFLQFITSEPGKPSGTWESLFKGLGNLMATVLDVGLLEYFLPAFIFFLVLIFVWAILEKVSFFGDNKFANMVIALCIAVLFIVVPEIQTIVALTTPWFVILFLFLFLLILTFLFMGVDANHIAGVFGGSGGADTSQVVIWAVIIIALGIFGYAFTQVYGEEVHNITNPDSDGDDLTQSIGEILFTPKILGMMFLIVLAGFSARFISMGAK